MEASQKRRASLATGRFNDVVAVLILTTRECFCDLCQRPMVSKGCVVMYDDNFSWHEVG